MKLTESNFEIYAIKNYINPNCIDKEEFSEDFKRIQYLKRLLKKYIDTGDLKERLILNHLIILYNTFENEACTRMIYFKLFKFMHILKPFLILINRMPEKILNSDLKFIYSSSIPLDNNVVNIIRKNIL